MTLLSYSLVIEIITESDEPFLVSKAFKIINFEKSSFLMIVPKP